VVGGRHRCGAIVLGHRRLEQEAPVGIVEILDGSVRNLVRAIVDLGTTSLKQIGMRPRPVQGNNLWVIQIVNEKPIRFDMAFPESLPFS
jgi:hypothetical protein